MFESLTRPTHRRYRDPFASIVDRLLNEMPRSGDSDYLTDTPAGSSGERNWLPPVDIFETDSSFVVAIDLPGIPKESIDVSIEDSVLTVSGERKLAEDKQVSFRRIERAYGSFRRSFTLPKGIESGKVAANFADGVLTLTLPKAEVIQSRKIAVA